MTLVITTRREDIISPLLSQWTYQAMIGELLGMKDNIVNMKKHKTFSMSDEDEYVLNIFEDETFAKNIHSNYGTLAANLKAHLEEHTKQNYQRLNIESVESMHRVLDRLPETKRKEKCLNKHINISSVISRLIQERNLLDLSKFEQDCSTRYDFKSHLEVSFPRRPLNPF
jgi:vacuolar protein sorting-associated protein 45